MRLIRFRPFFLIFFLFFFPLSLSTPDLSAQDIGGSDRSTALARDEFRFGVQAYNRYAFNEALLSFEKALSYLPGEALILEWLGRAYYRSGLEDTALRQWQNALDLLDRGSGEAMLLAGRIETVRNRRSVFTELDEAMRYVESGTYPGRVDELEIYNQPTSVLPEPDGSLWVVAYGSNELVRLDVNGIVRQRRRGPLNGFDRPYDIARGLDGRLYVSEYRGCRVSVLSSDGDWQSYIGSRGRGDGEFLGPQNMTIDDAGYLYVVDYGNRRVSKFDPDGAFILSFGGKSAAFSGFVSPTGIAAGGGRIFVADGASREIVQFDSNGSFLGVLVKEGLKGPESLRLTRDGHILAADTNRLVSINPDSAVLSELGMVGNSRVRITGADSDYNGNIIAANFDANEISLLTRLDDVASGLFVEIERVTADRFPLVTVEIQVRDRRRRPIVGLDARNFTLYEEGRAAGEQSFLGAAYRSGDMDISLLVERSELTRALGDELSRAARDTAAVSRVVSLVSAGEEPLLEKVPDANRLASAARGSPSFYSPRWRFDQGLRLAATELLTMSKKRAVVFITSGSLGENAFSRYGLSQLAAYLANNGIAFYAVLVGNGVPGEDLLYLCEQTGGAAVQLYRPEGIGRLIESLKQKPNGSYVLSYRSGLPADFGRAYLPVEAEVYMLERSGRDATGYFPPLE